ncbi:MAG: hypothetical protein HQK77_16775 [Desulfobacterales bacterium]|nr:hypothetical protein [Desulfobacterales bacterium]
MEVQEIQLDTANENLKNQLNSKLAEYKSRYKRKVKAKLQMDTICKIFILQELLEKSHITYETVRDKIQIKYKDDFGIKDFYNAWYVINDYCTTGGRKVKDGTGLPKKIEE